MALTFFSLITSSIKIIDVSTEDLEESELIKILTAENEKIRRRGAQAKADISFALCAELVILHISTKTSTF
jgi:hypothetical protein